MVISAADLARYRSLSDSLLVNRATVARTGITWDCRIVNAGGWESLGAGLPSWARVPLKSLIFRTDAGVMAGDELTMLDGSLYYVIGVDAPEDYSVKTLATCVLSVSAGGTATFPASEIVTLTSPTSTSPPLTDVPAMIYPAMLDAEVTPVALRYKWAVWLDPALRYADGTPIQAGDQMTWDHLDWPASLSEPRPILAPVRARCFYVEAVGGTGR